jgi:hypothetical protein
VAELFVTVAVLVPIAGLALGWVLQRKRARINLYDCSRCETRVWSRWEIKRCPACMKTYTRSV